MLLVESVLVLVLVLVLPPLTLLVLLLVSWELRYPQRHCRY